jgi:hypothetical protein
MPANVRSLEAIETVRVALASFREEIEQSLSTIDVEMRRVLDWLEHDRPRHWRTQVRIAMDAVTEARAALHRCLMYPVADERPSCHEERAALQRAEARLAYCQEKSERLHHWTREVQHEMFEYDGRIRQLRDTVEVDVPQAVAILERLLTRLHEYQAVRPRADGSADSLGSESMANELMPERAIPEPAKSQTPVAPLPNRTQETS